MDVLIVEGSTGKLIAKYPIVIKGQNYSPTKQEYFNEAWRCAVEDNLAKADRREDFIFSIGG